MCQSKDKAQCHSNQTNGCWVRRAMQGSTPLDQLEPQQHLELSLSLFLFLVVLALLSLYPFLSPSLSLSLLIPLSVYLALFAGSLFTVHPPDALSPFPPRSFPKKTQGQSCNPFTAALSTDSTQIILKDLQPSLGATEGMGGNESRNARGKTSKREGEESGEDTTERRRLVSRRFESSSRRWRPGVPSAWAERQTGAHVNLKED